MLLLCYSVPTYLIIFCTHTSRSPTDGMARILATNFSYHLMPLRDKSERDEKRLSHDSNPRQ